MSHRTQRRQLREIRQRLPYANMMTPLGAAGALGMGLPTPRVATASAPTAGMSIWLEANIGVLDGSGNPCTDGVAVATWQDQSGNGHDATQVSSGSRPIFKTGILAGLPIVRCAGANNLTHNLGLVGAMSYFGVVKRSGGVASFQQSIQCLNISTSGGVPNPLSPRTFGVNWGAYVSNEWESAFSVDGTWRVIGSVYRTGTDFDFITGTTVDTKSGGSGFYPGDGIDRRCVGGRSGEFFTGDIAELLAYSSALSTANRTATMAYLSSKYSL